MKKVQLGLRENAGLFSILVLMSAFVGAMVGFERSLLPELTKNWSVSEMEAALIMVGVFGLSKAIANLFTGKLIAEIGRKRTLLLGWAIALQAPMLLLHSADSALIILANMTLGLSQGFTWSTTVIMKIDIVGLKHRGTAMGLNESAGYIAVGASSAYAAYYAETSGLIAPILYVAMGIVLVAFLLGVFVLPETQSWVDLEAKQHVDSSLSEKDKSVFYKTTFGDPALRTITWAGVVNNANDGILWAVLPSLLLASGESLTTVGILTGIHASTWGLGQLFTGPLSNKGNIRRLLMWGMIMQGLALLGIRNFPLLWLPYILLGFGTAMVYPTFLVGISNHSHPNWRPQALSTYRFWRDMGYVFGALIGYLALRLNAPEAAFTGIAALTLVVGANFRYSSLK
ncbi:MAG: MFS transporter [Schleiferiaceae bacterium]|nr:MFS transporter [Schleiferiaceae bacterium]MDG1313811.1 MFS transporter [Schleiferiaceae bacterium]MDG1918266.1 MFS transporter [Schleiferiaceae bacterium]MDG2110520.1 MFS transporter [Schleiferiaceae bacterium]